jgi:hypothetical protein
MMHWAFPLLCEAGVLFPERICARELQAEYFVDELSLICSAVRVADSAEWFARAYALRNCVSSRRVADSPQSGSLHRKCILGHRVVVRRLPQAVQRNFRSFSGQSPRCHYRGAACNAGSTRDHR